MTPNSFLFPAHLDELGFFGALVTKIFYLFSTDRPEIKFYIISEVYYFLLAPKLLRHVKICKNKINSDSKRKAQNYIQNFISKKFRNNFFFLPVFYLIMWLMKVSKNFGKIAILKILKLISS